MASLTTYIAVWAAGLSTFTVVRDWYRLRARARVRVSYTALSAANATSESGFVLAATISNHGRDSIFLRAAGPQTDRGMTGHASEFPASSPMPIELRPGQSYTANFDADQLWAISSYGEKRCVRIIYYDQVGRQYASPFIGTGKPVKTDDSTWSLDPVKDVPRGVLAQWRMRRQLPPVT